MPIEIRELVIRASVDPKGGQDAVEKAGGVLDEKARRKLVAEAVAQTLDVLKRKHER